VRSKACTDAVSRNELERRIADRRGPSESSFCSKVLRGVARTKRTGGRTSPKRQFMFLSQGNWHGFPAEVPEEAGMPLLTFAPARQPRNGKPLR
jgi:hypothetical protein